MTADSSYSLEALERRWQLDKTPQVGLRLAEEYRRSGDFGAAIVTLAAGLEVYPTHTSTRVALSRYLVDAGRFSEAVPHLEQIVSLDPAHLVANKLLVGAYAGVGRVDEARDKLAIYEMMGEGDADIEHLRGLIETASGVALAGDGALETEAAVEGDPGFVVVSDPSADFQAHDPETDPETDSDSEFDPERHPGPAPEGPGDRGDPSAGLAPGVRGEVVEDLAGAAPIEPGDVAAFEPPLEEANAGFEDPFGTAFDDVSTSSYWQGLAGEGIFSLEADPADAPAAPAPAAGSTVTLAKLYLEQGHREKAIEVLGEVLEREPENREARRELEAIRAGRRGEGEPASSSAQRKREIITAYRARMRRAVAAGL